MPFYENRNVRLHYLQRDPGAKNAPEPMIFQHGIGGDVRQPSRFLVPERLGIQTGVLNIFHADFRGHGQSELGPVDDLSIASLGCDLAELLDHLELDSAIVGGISMGAAAALRLAVQYPRRCRALILSRPAWVDGAMNEQARGACALVANLLAAENWQTSALPLLENSELLQFFEAVCPDAAKSLRGQVHSVLAQPESRPRAIARLRHLPESRGLEDRGVCLTRVQCPTLILAAEGDPAHPFECAARLAQLLPNARLIQIAPKSSIDDRPHLEEVDRTIGEFLRSRLLN